MGEATSDGVKHILQHPAHDIMQSALGRTSNRDKNGVVVTMRLERSNGGDAIGERRPSRQPDAPSLAVDGKLKSSNNNNNTEYRDTRFCFGKEGENCRKKKHFFVREKTPNQDIIRIYTQISFKSSQVLPR